MGGVHKSGLGNRRGQGAGRDCHLCPLEPGVHPSPREGLCNRLSPVRVGEGSGRLSVWEGSGLDEGQGGGGEPGDPRPSGGAGQKGRVVLTQQG